MSDPKPDSIEYTNNDMSEVEYLRDVEEWADRRIAELESESAAKDERIAELTSFKDRVIGWREFDHPEYFCRATAEWIVKTAKEDKS